MAKNVNIRFTGDSSDLEKKTNNVGKSIEKLANTTKKTFEKSNAGNLLIGINSAMGIAQKTIGAVTKAFSVATKAIKDLNGAYLKQAKAEKQLEVAAKRNPYLDKKATKELKDYASELQKIGVIGDEELLPMMAKLAGAGRNQTQIQNIMKAALDMSASGAMSMDGAVDALNKTLNGTVGQLGRTIPEIKNLTKEQLANGEAIEIVARNYEGMSEEVSNATGMGQKLSNAFGDLKETIGGRLAPVIRTFQKILLGIVNAYNGILIGMKNLANATGIPQLLSKVWGAFADKIGGLVNTVKEFFNGLSESLKDFASEVGTVTSSKTDMTTKEGRQADSKNKVEMNTTLQDELKEIEARKKALADWEANVEKYYKNINGEEMSFTDLQLQDMKTLMKEREDYLAEQDRIDTAVFDIDTAYSEGEVYSKEFYNAILVDMKKREKEIKAEYKKRYGSGWAKEYKTKKASITTKQGMATSLKTPQNDAYSFSVDTIEKITQAEAELKKQLEENQKAIEANKQATKELEEENKKSAEVITFENSEAYVKYKNAVEESKNAIEARSKVEKLQGKEVDVEKNKLEQLNNEWKAYETLLKENTETSNYARVTIQEMGKALADRTVKTEDAIETEEEYKKILNELFSDSGDKGNNTFSKQLETMKEQLSVLKEQKAEWDEIVNSEGMASLQADGLADDFELCGEAIDRLSQNIKDLNFEKAITDVQTITDTIASGMSQLQGAMQQTTDFLLGNVEDDAENSKEKAEDEYNAGLISYEEYMKKKEEIDKDAAREEYKIKMAQWSMNLAQATANTAQAVVSALADNSVGMPLRIINSVTAGLLGAAQIAAVAGAKPPAPSFATGGFVGGMHGASMGRDNTVANVRTGEMIANAEQQKNLWQAMNGGSGGVQLLQPITIENNASNEVEANANVDDRQITITVNKIVNKSMKDGQYSASMQAAQQGFSGSKVY